MCRSQLSLRSAWERALDGGSACGKGLRQKAAAGVCRLLRSLTIPVEQTRGEEGSRETPPRLQPDR